MSSSKALTIIQQPTIGLVPHLSSFTIFSECFWVLYVSTSCLPRMFSSIDSSKRESVCGKAWWYGRDVPKIEVSFCSQKLITFVNGKIFEVYYVKITCLPRMFQLQRFIKIPKSVCGKASWYGGDLPNLENYFIVEGQQPSAMIIEDHDKLRQ